MSAHQRGLSIRRIAVATGLSAAHVHQILSGPAATAIPEWLSRSREQGWPNTDAVMEFVLFNRPRILRVIERIAADLASSPSGRTGEATPRPWGSARAR